MKKTSLSTKNSTKENKSNKRQELKVLLNSINETKPIENPIIAKLSEIYKNRKRYIGSRVALELETKIQEDFILATDSGDIFEDTKVVLELNNLESGELVTNSYTIKTEQFQTSAFDVLIAHYELMVSHNSVTFTANDKGNKIKAVSDILFIKSYNHRTLVFTRKGEYYICNIPFKMFLRFAVHCPVFSHIHRRYIVNLKAIEEVKNHEALIEINADSIESIKKIDLKLENKEAVNKKKEAILQQANRIHARKKENEKQHISESTSDDKDIKMEKFVHKDVNSKKVYLRIPIKDELKKDILRIIMNARKIE